MKVRGLSFNDDPEKQIRLYACGECGLCYSPKTYACGEAQAHEAARKAAEDCCVPRHCKECGVEVDRYRVLCNRCHDLTRLRKATPIPAAKWSDPVHSDMVSGDWGDGYSSEVAALLEDAGDRVAWGELPDVPAWCWPCTAQPVRLDPDSLLESAVCDTHEDAADQIVDADELVAFIEAWNAKQTCKSWYPDHSRVVVLDQARFEALLNDE